MKDYYFDRKNSIYIVMLPRTPWWVVIRARLLYNITKNFTASISV